MALLNIPPEKRIAGVIFYIEGFLAEARDAAMEKDKERLYQKLASAFELIDPLLGSLDILEASQRKSLAERLMGPLN